MIGASEEPTYEFDVAVSFAGEDRELVEEIVSRLKDAGVHVFSDTDYQAATWGEDLVEYLDQVYRLKARYAIMFISRFFSAPQIRSAGLSCGLYWAPYSSSSRGCLSR
jgi:hypothetical protein